MLVPQYGDQSLSSTLQLSSRILFLNESILHALEELALKSLFSGNVQV